MMKQSHENEACKMAISHPNASKLSIPFPWKLHVMLDSADTEGCNSIVSWLPGGNSFKVHYEHGFVTNVMPRYFKQTKYKSFQRQLNIWCFERISNGPDKGGYGHPNFVKGNPSLCRQMRRKKIKGSPTSAPPLTIECYEDKFIGSRAHEEEGVLLLHCADLELSEQNRRQDSSPRYKIDSTILLEQSCFVPLVAGGGKSSQCDIAENVDWLRSHERSLLEYGCNLLGSFVAQDRTESFSADEIVDELISTFRARSLST
jgi:hypothetical protein